MTLLKIDGLSTEFRLDHETVHAVDDVSLSLDPGETLAVVGESGSGKTALALSILRLHAEPPCVYTGGRILLDGRDLLRLKEHQLRRVRGGEVGMVFQDPMTNLNPVQTVGHQVAEAIRVHRRVSRAAAERKVVEALAEVGIPNPRQRARDYPHQFSGGMRQRAMIAMSLVCEPRVLIADEPTTALDVTVQAQVLEVLADLRRQRGLAILMITHDLGVVANMADRVMVMYAGRVVETGSAEQVFTRPSMPYTRALLDSTPRLDTPEEAELRPVPGQPPALTSKWDHCPFDARCPLAFDDCHRSLPQLVEGEAGHRTACLLGPDQVERQFVTVPEEADSDWHN